MAWAAATAAAVVALTLRWAASSFRARQSSVRLRQMLSALRRSCLSVTVDGIPVPMLLAPLEMGPGWPATPTICDRDMASVAAASMALKMSSLICGRALFKADSRMGWFWLAW